jgi:hypothetical protein
LPTAQPKCGILIGGGLALGALIGLGFWQRENISKWFNPQKVGAEVSEKVEHPIKKKPTNTPLPTNNPPAPNKPAPVNQPSVVKSPELTAQLEQMHAVFNEPAPDGKPWYKLKVNVLGEATETEASTYLEGVALVKDAKHLYLGDLHGSWLKGLLQLAQMEAIEMPEATAKEFLAIHKAFEAVEKSDADRIQKLVSQDSNRDYWKGLFKGHLDRVNQEIRSGSLVLESGETAQSYANIRLACGELNEFRKIYEFTHPETKNEVHALVKRFKEALSTVELIDPNKQLNLVGDVLGDRGPLDTFNLLLIDKFKNNINIVASNHDFITLDLLIHYLSGVDVNHYTNDRSYFNRKYFEQSQSSGRMLIDCNENTKKLLETEGVDDPSFTKAEIIQLYKDYFSRLKLIHYDEKDQSVMFHCLVRKETWQALVKFLKPDSVLADGSALSSEALTQAINDLNQTFQHKIMTELDSKTLPSSDFQELYRLLDKAIWFSGEDGRATSFDYSLFPTFGNSLLHTITGHDSYLGMPTLLTKKNYTFHQLDNTALKHDASNAESPVVISK